MRRSSGFLTLLLALGVFTAGSVPWAAIGQGLAERSESKALNDLLDREAIRDLPIIYCHYVWAKNVDGIVNQFTDDGELILPANLGGGAKGRQALRTFYQESIRSADPRPFVHNHYVTLSGDGRAKGYVYAEIRYGTQGFRTTTIGVYEDDYVKVGGAWKIQRRQFTATPVPN